jgi:hypothetical protein
MKGWKIQLSFSRKNNGRTRIEQPKQEKKNSPTYVIAKE